MIPTSISASALHVADLCLARYHASNYSKVGAPKSIYDRAALLGTTTHAALEFYVTTAIQATEHEPTLNYLLQCFTTAFDTLFGQGEHKSQEYKDGVKMLRGWHKRTDFSDVEVISCEVKENFMVPTSEGDIPFNFIWDRADRIKEGVYKIVDYKTARWNINHDDLKKKIQPRAYALAAAIKWKDAEEIWVEFDMLRHERVGIVFTREDNIETWQWIKSTAQRIIDTPESDPPETLNTECRFCIRKQACQALKENVSIGGIFSISTAEEAVDRRAKMEYQLKGLEAAIAELDTVIMPAMKERDAVEIAGEKYQAKIKVSSRREVDGHSVEKVVGTEKFKEYGGLAITVGQYEEMLKDPDLTDEQKAQLRMCVHKKLGEPKIGTEAMPTIGAR